MEALQGSDEHAFAEIYARYSKKIVYFFYKMLWRDMEMARDMHQEIFLRLIEKPGTYKRGSLFKAWFFSIANNMCKNEYRRNSVNDKMLAGENTGLEFEEISGIDETPENLKNLRVSIDLLGEEQKECIILRYYENFTIAEIAVILDCPPGTVKSRLFFARKKLAEHLVKPSELKLKS